MLKRFIEDANVPDPLLQHMMLDMPQVGQSLLDDCQAIENRKRLIQHLA